MKAFHIILFIQSVYLFLSPVTGPLFADSADPTESALLQRLQQEPPVTAEVRVERGGPRLFINDEMTFPFCAWSFRLLDTTPEFREAGVEILYPILHISDGWTGPDTYDWSRFDDFMLELLKMHPDAYLLPRVLLYAPDWWKDQHEDQLVKTILPFDHNNNMSTDSLLIGEGGQRWWRNDPRSVSFASDYWKNEATGMFRQFLRHYRQSPLKSRIIGYHPGSGTTGGEWHTFHAWYIPDISTPAQQWFDFIPDLDARLNTDFGLFRDPATEQNVIDYYEQMHQLTSDLILHFAHVLKEETDRELISGTFYTYLLENVFIQEGGHLNPEPVLESPDIDFIASPYTYQSSNQPDAKPGETDVYDSAGNWLGRGRGAAGDGGYRILNTSVRRHGKLPLVELDPATFVDQGKDVDYAGSGSESVEGSLRLIARDMGQVVATGSAGWLVDIGAVKGQGWYSPPVIVEEIKRWTDLGKQRDKIDIASVSDIAAVYDAKSFFATRHWYAEKPWPKGMGYQDFFEYWFLNSQARALHRLGAPVDFLYRFDLRDTDRQLYKLFLMVNLFSLTSGEVDSLLSLFKDSDATVVWFYAPGFVGEESLDLEQMQRLTGLTFDVVTDPGPMMITCNLPDPEKPVALSFGTDRRDRYPRFIVDTPEAEILGEWSDLKEPAMARIERDGWTSIYMGTAPLPVPVLRWLARQADVPLWSSKGDIVRAIRDATLLVATTDGERTLSLPKPLKSHDTGIVSDTHQLNLEQGEVRLFTTEAIVEE